MIDFALPEEISRLEEEIARFAERELRPRMREVEAAGAWDDAILKGLDDFELAGLDVPTEWGGAGAGALAKAVALEALAAGDAGGLPGAERLGPAAAAALACPDETVARAVVTACLRDGQRSFVSFVVSPSIDWLPGRTAPEWVWVTDGRRLALFDTVACSAWPVEAAAFHASGGLALELAGLDPAGEWTLDEDAAIALRGRARLWPAAVACGIARASLDYAIAYAKERVVMGRPVAHHQGNAFAIAEAAALLEAARTAGRAAAHRLDTAEPHAGLWATLAFLDAADAALHVTDLGVQLLGGHGYIEDHPAEKWFREARALTLLWGGRDAALTDAAAHVLDAPDPMLA